MLILHIQNYLIKRPSLTCVNSWYSQNTFLETKEFLLQKLDKHNGSINMCKFVIFYDNRSQAYWKYGSIDTKKQIWFYDKRFKSLDSDVDIKPIPTRLLQLHNRIFKTSFTR